MSPKEREESRKEVIFTAVLFFKYTYIYFYENGDHVV